MKSIWQISRAGSVSYTHLDVYKRQIAESPVTFELEVRREIHLAPGSDLFLCSIRNVMQEEALADQSVEFAQRLRQAAPVLSPGEENYVSIGGRALGRWGEPMKSLPENPEGD